MNGEGFVVHSSTWLSGAKGEWRVSGWLAISNTCKKYCIFHVYCYGFSQAWKSLYNTVVHMIRSIFTLCGHLQWNRDISAAYILLVFLAWRRLALCSPKSRSTSEVTPSGSKRFYHINYGVIQGFPALRKAVTTYVKKYDIFYVFDIANQLLTRHSPFAPIMIMTLKWSWNSVLWNWIVREIKLVLARVLGLVFFPSSFEISVSNFQSGDLLLSTELVT